MLDKAQILSFLKEHKEDFQKRFGVTKMGLFGSYARGTAQEESDIDIAIEMDKKFKKIRFFLSLERELEGIFHKKVDLGIESSLKPEAQKFIEKEIIYV